MVISRILFSSVGNSADWLGTSGGNRSEQNAKDIIMKCYEIKKGHIPESYGRAMMAIEGPAARIGAAELKLKEEGFESTNCGEDGEKEGDFIVFYMVSRSEVTDFKAAWKQAKAAV